MYGLRAVELFFTNSFFAPCSGPTRGAGFYEDLWLLKKTPLPRSQVAPTRPPRTG